MKFVRQKSAVIAGIASLALVLVSLQGVAASAEDVPEPESPPAPVVMGDYDPSTYVDEAAELPSGLVEAVVRDLGLTPEEYLAESDAAVQASDVVDALKDSGVDVLGSIIDGTELTVYVETDAAAEAVEAAGATAAFGEPVVEPQPDVPLEFAEDIYGGQSYFWSNAGDAAGTGFQCSVGFNGFATASGAKQLATAGHCTDAMATINGSVKYLSMIGPANPSGLGGSIGLPVSGATAFGGGYDVGRISVSASNVAKAAVLTWGSSGSSVGSGAPLSSTPIAVTRRANATVGANLCHSGATTGWRCGKVTELSYEANVGGDTVNSITADVCVLPGDSGGPAMIGTAAVGITSWHPAGESGCSGTSYGGFFPMQGDGETVATAYGDTWELAVAVATPVVTTRTATRLAGTLAGGTSDHRVLVYLDGSSTPLTAPVSSGAWAISLPKLSSGSHTFVVRAAFGTWSRSADVPGTITAANFTSTPVPTITGNPKVGQYLKSVVGTWTPSATFVYQWFANGVAIAGATGSGLRVSSNEFGKQISVKVTGSRSGYYTIAKASTRTAAVVTGNFSTSPVPKILGSRDIGATLTASEGAWSPAPNFAYQWYASNVAIAGAQAKTFTLTSAQAGKKITVKVTASQNGYMTTNRTSGATGAIFATTATPTISGVPKVAAVLTASVGSWSPAASITYQWKADGVAISGATAATFSPTAAQVGKKLTVSAQGVASGYATVIKDSAPTAAILLTTFKTAPVPTISGNPAIGYTLSVVQGTWSPSAIFAYRWYADGAPITGATASTFTLTSAQGGKQVTVQVKGSRAGYVTPTRTSVGTGKIFLTAPAISITGTAKVGRTLAAVAGAMTPTAQFDYQWYANGSPIPGAVSSSFKLTSAQSGAKITVRMKASRVDYATIYKTSQATSAVI